MIAHWEMRVALATLEADAFAIPHVHGWGLVLPQPDGTVAFQIRHRWGTTANVLPDGTLSAPLHTPIASTRLAAITRDDGPLEEQLVLLGIERLAAVPLPHSLGLMWAGGAEPFHHSGVPGDQRPCGSHSRTRQ